MNNNVNEIQFKRATAFISSTFADMKDERDLICYTVLPRVKRWAFSYGIIFDTVDLRWGINDEQARDLHQTVRICLERVADSSPLFICLIGERYGWIPSADDFNQSMFEKSTVGYSGLSATELEIIQGLNSAFIDSDEKRCLFLLRDSLNLDALDEKTRRIYKDEENESRLSLLKERLSKREDAFPYSCRLSRDGDRVTLRDFTQDERSLGDFLFEKITDELRQEYGITDSTAKIVDDALVHQKFYLRYLTDTPPLPKVQDKLYGYFDTLAAHGILARTVRKENMLLSQIAHLIDGLSSRGEYKVVYRFFGIDERMLTANDLICSLAYELLEDSYYLDNPPRALIDLKRELEISGERVVLIIAGLDWEGVVNIFGTLTGLNFYKSLLLVDTGEGERGSGEWLDYDEDSFRALTLALFSKRAKLLTDAQCDKILKIADGSYSVLRLLIHYLCTLATHDSLEGMIDGLSAQSPLDIVRKILDELCGAGAGYGQEDITRLTLKLLCASPYPIREEDILGAIALQLGILDTDGLSREVSFSLSLLRELLVEYDSGYKIYDTNIRRAMLTKDGDKVVLPSALKALYRYYLKRLERGDGIDRELARNLCELAKDSLFADFKEELFSLVFNRPSTFLTLARLLDKRELVELTGALAKYAMGHAQVSTLVRQKDLFRENIEKAAIDAFYKKQFDRELIHRSREAGGNKYQRLYSFALTVGEEMLSGGELFEKRLSEYMSEKTLPAEIHRIELPLDLAITERTSTVYTAYDIKSGTLCTYLAVCHKGFLILLDALSGKMCGAYAIPRDVGEPIGVFYQNHTLSVVFSGGIITLITPSKAEIQSYRFELDDAPVRSICHCINNSRQVAILDGRAVELLHGMRREDVVCFKEGMTVTHAFTAHPRENEVGSLIIFVRDSQGYTKGYLYNRARGAIVYAYDFANNYMLKIHQNEDTGEVYLVSNAGFTFIVSAVGDASLEVGFAEGAIHLASEGVLIEERDGGIFVGDTRIPDAEYEITLPFATENASGFIDEDNVLYYVAKEN